MRQDFFVYTPTFKLVIAGNHKPSLRSVDEAIRRRFHLIPTRQPFEGRRRALLVRPHVAVSASDGDAYLFQALIAAKPQVPQKLNDRAQDNWEPLLAIADSCGDEWGAKARKIACKLSGEEDDQTHGIMLLQDIKDLFEQERVDRLASTEIVADLEGREDRPWPEFYQGKAITPRGVARLLEPFSVKPRQVVIRGRKVQGYRLEQFKWAFKRYLPIGVKDLSPVSPELPAKSKMYLRKYALKHPLKRAEVSGGRKRSGDKGKRGSGHISGGNGRAKH